MFIAFVLLFGTFGCQNTGPEPDDYSVYYRSEQIALPDNFSPSDDDLHYTGGKILLGGYTPWNRETKEKQDKMLFTLDDATGDTIIETVIDNGGEERTLCVVYDDDGKSGKIEAVGVLSDMAYEKVTVRRYDKNGSVVSEYDCSELFDTDISKMKANRAGEGIFTVCGLYNIDDGLIIVSNIGAVKIGIGENRLLRTKQEITGCSYVNKRLFVICNNGSIASEVDFNAEAVLDPIKLPSEYTVSEFFALDGYELAFYNGSGIYGINTGEDGSQIITLLCGFIDSGITGIQRLAAVSLDRFYVTVLDDLTFDISLWRLTAIPTGEYKERQTLDVLVLISGHSFLSNAITELNRVSEDYRFSVTYRLFEADSSQNITDISDITDRFNNDIVLGDIPDIVIMAVGSYGIDPEIYAEKGLFCDLYSLMEKNGYDRSNLLECITSSFERVDPYSKAEILPYIPLKSTVSTLMCDADDYQGRLTLENVFSILDSGKPLTAMFGGKSFIEYTLRHDLESYINFETGETSFTSERFLKLMSYYKRVAEGEFEDVSYETGYISEFYAFMLENNIIFTPESMTDPFIFLRGKALLGIDKYNCAGYVDTEGSGITLEPTIVIAITEKCAYKDQAWKLAELLLSDRYVLGPRPMYVPVVTHSALDKYLGSIARYYLIKADGTGTTSSIPFTAEKLSEDVGSTVLHINDEYIAGLKLQLQSARAEPVITDKIMSIISEELSEYTAGVRSAEDTAKIINNRVSVMYNEQK